MLNHDLLAGANWQRAAAGKRKPPKPKPLSPLAKKGKTTERYGTTDRSPDEVKAMLARYGPAPVHDPTDDPVTGDGQFVVVRSTGRASSGREEADV